MIVDIVAIVEKALFVETIDSVAMGDGKTMNNINLAAREMMSIAGIAPTKVICRVNVVFDKEPRKCRGVENGPLLLLMLPSPMPLIFLYPVWKRT